ncbi:MAG: hypothetical protein ABI367_05650 [Mucilaginibacter sp.]
MSNTMHQITQTLLFCPDDAGGIYKGVHQLHDIFAASTGVKAGDITDKDIYLPSGKAVSTIKAAHCLLEFERTAVFLRGVYQAIIQLKKDYPDTRLHVLYAGCGPYATLLTPLTSVFGIDEIAFHLLDINEDSIAAAQKLYAYLKLDGYVEEWLLADATTYYVPEGEVMHLMISETMLNALRKEPQVAIMLNLVPQLPDKGLFIPQEITVSAQLLSPRLETDRYLTPDTEPERINLGNIYTIGRYNCAKHKPVTIKIPEEIGRFRQLSLLTTITTFGNEKLGTYTTSLTMPLRLFDADDCIGKQVKLTYQISDKPGFEYEWVEDAVNIS